MDDVVVWQGLGLVAVGLMLGTLGEVLVEDRGNAESTRILGRAIRLLGLAMLIGGAVLAALAYAFPPGSTVQGGVSLR
jgi:hypothetical protein